VTVSDEHAAPQPADRSLDPRLSQLTQLSRAFTNARSLDDILQLAVHQAVELLSASKAVLMLTDVDGMLRVRAAIGVSDDVVSRFRQSFDESLVTRLQGLFGVESTDGFVGVPLVAQGRVTGLLAVVRPRATPATAADEALLSALADQTAAPLEHALLTERVERAALVADNLRLYEAERAARVAAEYARAEAEAANRAKSQFLTTMSHELRTPLNAIAGYVELMEMGLHGSLTEEQRQDLRRIRTSQRALLGLVEDVLDMAKLETGRIELRFAVVSLHEILKGVETLVFPQLFAKSLQYRYHDTDPAVAVRVDRERFQQILVNLLTNAIKFTAPGGSVALRADIVGGDVWVRVEDTGPGIPANKLEEIFEPFVRVDSTLTRSTEGSGLGLAISRSLARAMGGDLTVESTVGVGSIFSVRLARP
jgi:signal transduction histidine kinase